ncbi:hypothetical protein [Pontibacter arcticus]|uniref:Uncharacterized protein n=1 Tax=Pontibacter arcticus TaxID=2080288 RepID=A0A364RG62_9BACT|nr:hypothetical protein [Pontibacter arcticus]RAU83273.1 hypothetical protein DP923_08670 [Pontibacter arcticus]
MEDFKIILYILAAVAYFVFNAFRKAFKTDATKENTLPDKPVVTAKPVTKEISKPAAPKTSFEDILRELQPKMEKANEQERKVTPRPVVYEQPTPVFTYEQTKTEARSLETIPDERIKPRKRKSTLQEIQTPAAYMQQQQKRLNPYRALLQNPNSAKQAFILSEIFNRKY